jgi:PAS domain S-box-containing protein
VPARARPQPANRVTSDAGPVDFEHVFQAVPGCYLVLNPQLAIVGVNDAYLRATMTERAAIMGRPLFEVFPDNPHDPNADGVANLLASLERVIDQRRPDRMAVQQYDMRRPDAQGGGFEVRYWSPINTPVLDDNGTLTCIVHCVEDVTETVRLREQDEALRQLMFRSEHRFAQLLDAAPDAIVVVSPDARIDFVNGQTEKLFGYSRSELVGAPVELLIPERLRASHAAHMTRFMAQPSARPMGTGVELVACKKDGAEFPIEVSLSPMDSEQGSMVSAAIRDISQRKRIEAEAKLNADRFASAVENMHHAFAMFDGEQRLVRCNAAYRDLLAPSLTEPLVGRSRQELVDAWLRQLDPTLSAPEAQLRAQWLDRGYHDSRTFELRTREHRNLRVTDRPTSQGDLVEVVWDVTDDERRADELRLARVEAEAASAAKSEFLSSMSHELRTPMNAILGFAQLLVRDAKQPLIERHRERVAQILRGGEQLLRLIDDVLDLAGIEAGRVSISAESVGIDDVLDRVTSTLEPLARQREVELRREIEPAGVPPVFADRVRLIQILTNFGTNAIKYNRTRGHVSLRAERREHRLRLIVEDDGVGIPLDQQSKLFQPFQRAGQETGPIEGTGIGLLITKRLAELMGGHVGFHSEVGAGSCFWVELPLAASMGPSEARTRSVARPVALGGAQAGVVLYVEDNPANIAFMSDLFESLDGYRLVTAKTAEEGLTLANILLPQLVIMDINLPGMSGTQALSALRKMPKTRRIPVIALTAAASERDRKRGLSEGFFRYLTKPLDIDELTAALQSAVASQSHAR